MVCQERVVLRARTCQRWEDLIVDILDRTYLVSSGPISYVKGCSVKKVLPPVHRPALIVSGNPDIMAQQKLVSGHLLFLESRPVSASDGSLSHIYTRGHQTICQPIVSGKVAEVGLKELRAKRLIKRAWWMLVKCEVLHISVTGLKSNPSNSESIFGSQELWQKRLLKQSWRAQLGEEAE